MRVRNSVFTLAWCGASFTAMPTSAFGAGEDLSNVERGTAAQYVKVVGRGIVAEAHGDDLHVGIRAIQLESTGKLAAVRYSALGIAVFRDGKMVGATWNFDIGGELTTAVPSVTLTDRRFTVRWLGPPCLQGGCEVRLQLRVETGRNEAHAEHTGLAALRVTKASPIPKAAPPKRASGPQTFQDWENWLSRVVTAMSQKRYEDAGRWLYEALVFIEKTQGAGRPGAARVRYLMADLAGLQNSFKVQELRLLESLAILERYPDAEVRKAIGAQGGPLDKEIVARRLASLYWDQRRYDRAYEYYDRAYRHANGVVLSSAERNLRLARNSGGRMFTACTLGKWDIADSAMKELKERAVHVTDAEARKQLDDWISTGELRLAVRRC